jgi:hypothetical protein
MKDPFQSQPELPGRISHSEIIVADEADIKEDAAGADFCTDLPTDFYLIRQRHTFI